jgi:hypothetical protein
VRKWVRILTECESDVTPDQPWSENGTADVVLKPSCNLEASKKLPLEHRPRGDLTILRANYPNGVVIIPNESSPQGESAVLPTKVTDESQIIFADQDWPEGCVGMFIDL